MADEGPATATEEVTRVDAHRFRVVATIAAVVCTPFALVHVTIAFTLIPSIEQMLRDMGGQVPAVTQAVISLSKNGVLGVLLLALDVGIFWLMYRLAKRYWIGLLFVPVFAYMAISASLIPVLYLPLFSVISLVQ